jgi:hypothetical protein
MRLPNLLKWRPSAALTRKLAMVGVFMAASLGAFWWGRLGSRDAVHAQAPTTPLVAVERVALAQPSGSDYHRRIVAQIYGNVPITREDLGEYLIARFGAERLEFLVNRRIVEMACKSKGIHVEDVEIMAQFQEDLKSFGLNEKEFVNNVLKPRNKSVYEWKEDVLRPKLALAKLVRPTIEVTPEEIKKAFDARFGPKVQCRIIILQKNDPHKDVIWNKVSKSEDEFRDFARKQFIADLASRGGMIPPISRNFPDPEMEREAFSLQEGQVSAMLGLRDGTIAILKCDKRLPADTSKRIEDERLTISRELAEIKLAQKMPEVFNQLRKEASPQMYLNGRTVRQDELEASTLREIQGAPGVVPAANSVPGPGKQ